jgi:acetylglutamate kinase
MSNVRIGLPYEACALIRQGRGARRASEELAGKRVVIKLGGSTLASQRPILEVCLWLQTCGAQLVLVHGGGAAINAWLEKMHLPVEFKNGQRVTDGATLEIVRMVLCGQVNQGLVSLAAQMGAKAVGLCGTDGQMIQAHILDQALGFVGAIDAVSPALLDLLLREGYVPILAPFGQGPWGTILNINADHMAAAVAKAIDAEMLIFLSDVAGIHHANGSAIAHLSEHEASTLLQEQAISGGMIPKVEAALRAVQTIPFVQIIDGARPQALLQAALWQEGGTRFLRQDDAPDTRGISHVKEQKGDDPGFVRHTDH